MSGNYQRMNHLVHNAVRRDLDRIGQVAQEPLALAQREALARRVVWLVGLLHHHHESEDEAIWPVAIRKSPQLRALVDEMTGEHAAMAAAADELRDAATGYAAEGSENSRKGLLQALERMRAVCLPHLDHEETVAVPQLVEVFDDREWATVDKRFRKGVGLNDLGWIAMWL